MDLSLNTFELDLQPLLLVIAVSAFGLILIRTTFRLAIPLAYRGNVPRVVSAMEQPIMRSVTLFIILAVSFTLVKTNPLSGTVLVLIMIGGCWSFLRNFLGGIIILASRKMVVGNKIKTGEHEGTVDALNWFEVSLKKRNGELVSVPYVNISEMGLTFLAPSETSVSHSVTLTLDRSATDVTVVEQNIRRSLEVSPWVINNPTPSIERTTVAEGLIELRITMYGIDLSHLKMVEEEIRSMIQLKRA